MAQKARRLGRGLSSLLSSTLSTQDSGSASDASELSVPAVRGQAKEVAGDVHIPVSDDPIGPAGQVMNQVRLVACTAIEPNRYQPRLDPKTANLEELADSIRQVGVLSPLLVRAKGEGRFELIAGERRWRASQLAGLIDVPAIVREVNDEQMLEEALIENVQREDLNPIDRALAYRQYSETFKLTIEQVAERVGEKRQTVSNFLRLLDLDDEIQELISRGVLSAGHGKALAVVADKSLRLGLVKTVVARSLSVRGLEELVRSQKRTPADASARGGRRHPSAAERRAEKRAVVADLEERFSQAVGTHVVIEESRPKGTGKIVIEYHSLDDFDRIAAILGVKLDDGF